MRGTLQKFTGQETWASGRAERLGWALTSVFPKLEDSADREGMEEGPSWQGNQSEVSRRGNKHAGHSVGGDGAEVPLGRWICAKRGVELLKV